MGQGMAWHGRHGPVSQGMAGCGLAGSVWLVVARPVMARCGSFGWVCLGQVWQVGIGMVGFGIVGQGPAGEVR